VTWWAEVIPNGTVRGEKSLGMPGRCKSSHRARALAGWLVRMLGSIIEAMVLAMLHSRQHFPLRHSVASERIGIRTRGTY
jgi:hypothetical protein